MMSKVSKSNRLKGKCGICELQKELPLERIAVIGDMIHYDSVQW